MGNNIIAFNNANEGIDNIYSFDTAKHVIQVSAAGFGGGLSTGQLSASQFIIGSSAATSSQLFIYDNITGALFFDQDGSGSGTQVQLASLSTGLSLSTSNFVVV